MLTLDEVAKQTREERFERLERVARAIDGPA